MSDPEGEAPPAVERFDRFAEAYATSADFAAADELPLLVRLAAPQRHESVLDVATGAGHTALAFAPHVARVVATDVAPGMLAQGRRLAAERGIGNVTFEAADAQALPYGEAAFAVVTCRIAAHHFREPRRFLAEAHRVLAPAGRLLIQDHVAPDDPQAAREIDAFERLRDPSHLRAYPLGEWRQMLDRAGFEVTHAQPLLKRHGFAEWTSRQGCSPETVSRLVALMRDGGHAMRAWTLAEAWGSGEASFCNRHIVLLCTRSDGG